MEIYTEKRPVYNIFDFERLNIQDFYDQDELTTREFIQYQIDRLASNTCSTNRDGFDLMRRIKNDLLAVKQRFTGKEWVSHLNGSIKIRPLTFEKLVEIINDGIEHYKECIEVDNIELKKKQRVIIQKKDHTFLQIFHNNKLRMNAFIQLMITYEYLSEDGKWNKSLYKQGGVIRPIIRYLEEEEIIKKLYSIEELGRIFNNQFGPILAERNYRKTGYSDILDPSFKTQLSQLKKIK